ncbi:hypothetical protein B7Z17_00605 [Candidatus Saccharibacteria bacterium 32-49-10]|nr:MAG: hypothetical protein B7Z17_00605 [Candidatus Saccharibacteria bacterium 32-49-10]
MFMSRRVILLIIIGLGLVVIPLLIWGITSVSQFGKVNIPVAVAPNDAEVKVGDQTFKNRRSINLEPGEYQVTVSKDGFETASTKLIVDTERKGTAIIAPLLPVSEAAIEWYRQNERQWLELEGLAGEQARIEGQALIDDYPLTAWLPIQTPLYSIGYRQPAEGGVVITIDSGAGYREAAFDAIREKGIDPSDYSYEFKNLENPFDDNE